ncbi:hypothetical protein ASPZODRAFT_146978 [Penicilliopsis zonata CBS 506.65]|uniref:Sortilin N-terminal domain-containing protein n=1 Tax=Penicilliopsis zonata CBS 506.65 TaxID=1073090 RepID=A0A1L9S6N1_9EURO|nr:hypothetical protein ASPZODRAFT_146978 [Penicilliopsis zonata CBS 506.65]OJJ42808.1 hypothetical protein ASPZODRAFT_146978 [Penicilliopsis zonata CBS 506.65]
MKQSLRQLGTLLVSGTAAAAAAVASANTASHAYEFNSVAVTGGGYITGILGHPTEKNLLYMRSDVGSSYRWEEALNKWIPLTDFISGEDENLFGTESLAMDPTDPDRLYLAQGRYTTSNNSAFYVSDDRGATFTKYTAPFVMGSNELGRNNGERLAVNPFKPSELLMGTRMAGLMKSSNRAQTWTNVTSFPDAAANGIGLVFVIYDPVHEGTIYVGASVPNGLYYTTDGGSSWATIPDQPTTWDSSILTFPNETQPQSTGPQPMKGVLASNGLLYVTFSDAPGPYGVDYGEAWVYNTSSSTWSNITPSTSNTSPAPYSNQTFPRGGYCGLSVAATDPNTVVIASLDRDPGPALDSIYLSRDAGVSWKDISQLSTPTGSGGYWGHPIDEAALDNGTTVPWLSFNWGPLWSGYGAPSPIVGLTKFGWWMTAVLIDPTDADHLLYGTGATIWATDSLSRADADWAPTWYVQAQGIEETVALAMISPSEGAHLISGFGDINGMRHDDLDLPQPMLGLPVFSNLDTLDWAGQAPNVVVRAGACGHDYGAEGCGQAAYSTDGAHGWRMFPSCIPGVNTSTDNAGVLTVDASGAYFVWSAAATDVDVTLESEYSVVNGSGPYASSDGGQTWTSPSGLTFQTANLASDKVQDKTFYAYDENTWYVSTDGGVTYTASQASSVGLPDNATGSLPVVSVKTAGEVWLALGDEGVYHTTDFGASWKAVSAAASVTAKLITVGAPKSASAPESLFILGQTSDAVTQGVYRSDDGGSSWVRVNDDAHQYGGIELIQGDPRVYSLDYSTSPGTSEPVAWLMIPAGLPVETGKGGSTTEPPLENGGLMRDN